MPYNLLKELREVLRWDWNHICQSFASPSFIEKLPTEIDVLIVLVRIFAGNLSVFIVYG